MSDAYDVALARVPGLGGFIASQNLRQRQGMGDLQQAGALQGILMKKRALEQDMQLRGALSQLPPDAAPEDIAKTLMPYHPDVALRVLSDAKNRADALDERRNARTDADILRRDLAAQSEQARRDEATRREQENKDRDQQRALDRMELARLVASNRQPRQAQWQKVEDIHNPGQMIIVNPDIYNPDAYRANRNNRAGILGGAEKMTQAGAANEKSRIMYEGVSGDIQMAEDLLMGVRRTSDGQVVQGNRPTGSGLGTLVDRAAGVVGVSPSGAAESRELEVVGSRLLQRVPRFEGPQSDKDVAEYRRAAANVGDSTIPIAQRLAALRTMKQIFTLYETGQRGRIGGDSGAGRVRQPGAIPPPPQGYQPL